MRAALAWAGAFAFWSLVAVGALCFFLASRLPLNSPEDA